MTKRLPKAFLDRMRTLLGGAYAAYLCAMEAPPRRALRVNTCKITEESFRDLVDFTITETPILQDIAISSMVLDDNANTYMPMQQNIVKSSDYSKKSERYYYNEFDELVKSTTERDDNTNTDMLVASDIAKSSNNEENNTNHAPHCWLLPEDVAIGKHPLHAAGLCYVQEPTAQIPATLLGAHPGMTVLDLCAAPGGKAGQLAAAMGNAGLLIANEPVPARAETLAHNLERLGVRNAVVTCMYPDALCERLAGMCDAVLVDAPCSGEGMFRRDAAAIADWSMEHVRACAVRQRAILDAADRALRPGGALVYATCTFSPEENEETVGAFLDAHADYALLTAHRLYPHTSAGEGQCMAKLVKGRGGLRDTARPAAARAAKPIPAWEAFCADTFATPPTGAPLMLPDGRVLLPPEGFDRLPEGLRILRAGVLAGEVRQGRFVPAHALAMATPGTQFLRRVPLAGDRLCAYLAGETVGCDPALSGWCAATYAGYPLGFGKAVGGTLKNHLPKGLRIRG